MSRYIDADELYKETEKKIKANHEIRMAVVDDEFLDLINDAPTEDVAPIADTVRKMQERLKDKMLDNVEGRKFRLLYEDELDQIGKEILEEG